MTEPTRSICQPWAALPDLPASRPVLVKDDPAANDDAWESILWQASEMLFALSARQFTGRCESTVELREHRPRERGWIAEVAYGPDATSLGGAGGGAIVMPGTARTCRWRGKQVAALPGRPIVEVTSVTLAGEPLEAEVDLDAGLLWRADERSWPLDGSVLVSYTHGARPDVGGVRAAVTLALELGKAARGDEGRLPKRMQSISREGVTVSYSSTFESLAAGRTGIWEIDSWLASVNKYGFTAMPSVYSPDVARARRKVITPP